MIPQNTTPTITITELIDSLSRLVHGSISENSIRLIIDITSHFVSKKIEPDKAIHQIRLVLGDSELARSFEKRFASGSLKLVDANNNVNENTALVKYSSLQLHPVSSLARTRSGGSSGWTADEDKRLIEAVQLHGGRNWKAIAREVNPCRTLDQCSQHWFRVLNPDIRKGKWSEDEDKMLMSIIRDIGTGSWKDIAARMKGRTDIQVRYRYARLCKAMRERERCKGLGC